MQPSPRVPIPTDAVEASSRSVEDGKKQRTSLVHPLADFWLLGGASILVWAILFVGDAMRDSSLAVQNRFMQLGMTFALLSLFCNHPHFIVSYRFGYGRGLGFVWRNFFSLVVLPVALIGAYVAAYVHFDVGIEQWPLVQILNDGIAWTGVAFRLGVAGNLGTEVMGLSIWLMYLTVGWHYSKQVFGCMMVYSRFDGFPVKTLERRLLRANLIAIAIHQFVFVSGLLDSNSIGAVSMDSRFPGVKISTIGFPGWMLNASSVLVGATSLAVIAVFFRRWLEKREAPSANFVIPWVAFHFWYCFASPAPEYYFIVPFFHSLQYLPFAYRVESSRTKDSKWIYWNVSFRVIGLLVAGFLAFEFVPSKLDQFLETDIDKLPFFFVTAAVIFINVHHFFIDSVVWKLRHGGVSQSLTSLGKTLRSKA